MNVKQHEIEEVERVIEEKEQHRQRLLFLEKQKAEVERQISNTKWQMQLCDLDLKHLREGKPTTRHESADLNHH